MRVTLRLSEANARRRLHAEYFGREGRCWAVLEHREKPAVCSDSSYASTVASSMSGSSLPAECSSRCLPCCLLLASPPPKRHDPPVSSHMLPTVGRELRRTVHVECLDDDLGQIGDSQNCNQQLPDLHGPTAGGETARGKVGSVPACNEPKASCGVRANSYRRQVTIARAARSAVFPARFVLMAPMNLCPCGYHGDERRACRCTPT